MFSVQLFRLEVSSPHHFPHWATNYSGLLFSHTQPLQSVNASSLTSQGCCLCTVLLCRRRLVPLGLCTLIPLSLSGSRASVEPRLLSVWASPAPLSFSLSQPLSTHTKYHGPQVWKPQNKRASSLFWGMLQDVQVSEDIKERKKLQQLNNGPVVSTNALSLMVQGQ